MPERFEPPNGVRRSRRNQQLTHVMPTSMAAAVRCARPRLLGPDRRRKAIGAVVGEGDRLVVIVERRQMRARAEDFIRDHAAVRGSPVQTVGSTQYPPANPCISGTPPPASTSRTLGLRPIVVAKHLAPMLFADDRPHGGRLVEGIAEAIAAGLLRQIRPPPVRRCRAGHRGVRCRGRLARYSRNRRGRYPPSSCRSPRRQK